MSDLPLQFAFSRMVPRLIDHAHDLGFEVTGGHWFRCEDCQVGQKDSKHKRRLAIDLHLFKDGKYLTSTEDHRQLGEWWESEGGIWGGRWPGKKADGNHYEWKG